MSQGVNVGSVEALADLRATLSRYTEDVGEALTSAAREIAATQAWLEQCLSRRQAIVRRCNEEVAAIMLVLRRCYSTEDAYCGQIEEALSNARARLRAAEEELAKARRWASAIAEAAQTYGREAQSLSTLLTSDVPHAAAALDNRIAALQQYASLGAGVGTVASLSDSLMHGLIGGTAGALAVGAAAVAAAFSSSSTPAGEVSAVSDTSSTDIRPVPLTEINVSDSHVHSPADFSKVSHDEMIEGFRKLEDLVQPSVERGWTGDDFSRLDAERGLDYEHGYHRIYDAFYGSDAIRLEHGADGQYTVVNGYHRLYVASEQGIAAVPARIIEIP